MTDLAERLKVAIADRYAIDRELGQGGMATVYLAHDIKHDRKVALKVLRPELAAVLGAERFVVEIKTTAALQHPHILPLFDSGTADGFLYYVMPFIAGETLRDKLDRETQLGVEEAVTLTTAVADALDYAHRHGVIHRDIKPENILLHDGRPMVADFGIALAVSAAAGGRMTETGLSLGTPHYMSPEQATAEKEISARSDVYSLASVLYEMLAGQPPHLGGSAQQIIMKIIAEDARPVTELRKAVAPNVAAAVAKALEKLPADRFASAAEFAAALENPAFTTGTTGPTAWPGGPPARRPAIITLAAVAVLASLLAAWGWLRPTPRPPLGRFNIALAETQAMQPGRGPRVAVSPDGLRFVYVGPGDGGAQLWVRDRDQLVARPLAGTNGAISPFFSPDGRRVGYFTIAPMRLKTVSLGGEPPVTVADSGIDWDGGTWGRDGYIYADSPDGLVRVAQGSGRVERVTRLDTARAEAAHNYPDMLPNLRGLLFTILRGGPGEYEIAAVDLATGAHHVLTAGVYARYAEPGYLVYVTAGGTLMAVPFDQARLQLRGEPTALAEGIGMRGQGYVDLDLSRTGTLLYSAGGASAALTDLVWVSRDGEAELIDSNAYDSPVIAPDGRRIAVAVTTQGDQQIWIRQLPDGPSSKLTFDGNDSGRPFFAPDGRSVAYYTTQTSVRSLFVTRTDGSAPPEVLLTRPRELWEGTWSRDGRWLVYREGSAPSADLMAVRTDGDSTPVTLVATVFNERSPTLSPDGEWLAYTSDESGINEIYVRPFPETGRAKRQVSLDGGSEPLWAHSGRELFYRNPAGDMVAVEITTQPTFAAGRQTVLFAGAAYAQDDTHRQYDVSQDDRRFLMIRERGGERGSLVLVDNWFQELVAKVGR
ncbi:MAG TPA: protein kinase [Gemmatimonadales bacterium]